MMEQPYAVARPDEIYVPWGRPADLGGVPGIHADPLTEASAALALMVERVTFNAELELGRLQWYVLARLRRLDEKMANTIAHRRLRCFSASVPASLLTS